MPQRDTYHDAVKTALLKDGWTVTHDPLILAFGIHKMFVDLGAERLLAAERGQERIAVEIDADRTGGCRAGGDQDRGPGL